MWSTRLYTLIRIVERVVLVLVMVQCTCREWLRDRTPAMQQTNTEYQRTQIEQRV
jgi:hypothetical protein